MVSPKLRNVIVCVVTAVWALNVVVGFFWPDRTSAAINPIFALIVGGVLALEKGKRGKDGDGAP